MRPQIGVTTWEKMAPAISRHWKDLSELEVKQARKGQAELGQVIKKKYLLTPQEVDEQIESFLNAHVQALHRH